MAVQIPTIQRMAPQAPTSVGRIEAQAPDTSRALGQSLNAVSSVGDAALKTYYKAEDDFADTKATEAANAYEIWRTKQIHGDRDPATGEVTLGIINQEGDPTEAYHQLDIESKKKMKELTSGNDYNDYVKNKIQNKIAATDDNLYQQQLVTQGAQYAKYEKQVYADGINLAENKAVNSVILLKAEDYSKGDEDNALDISLADIKAKHEQYMSKIGLDPDSNATKLAVAKSQSEVIYNAATNLLASDELDKAKALLNNYSAYLDPVNKQKITNQLDTAEFDDKLYKISDKLSYMLPEDQTKEIDKIDDVKLKSKVREKLRSEEAVRQQLKDLRAKQNYNIILKDMMQKETEGIKYQDVYQLEQSPAFKNFGKDITGEQHQALKDYVVNPKNSDVKSLEKLTYMVVGKAQKKGEIPINFKNLSPDELMTNLRGLDPGDRAYYQHLYEKLNTDKPEVYEKVNKTLGSVDQQVENNWNQLKGLKWKNSKWSADKALFKSELQKHLIENDIYGEKEVNKFINEEWMKKKTEITAEPEGWFSNFFGKKDKEETKSVKISVPTTSKTKEYTEDQIDKMSDDYMAAHGGKDGSVEEVKRWFESKGK